MELSKSIYRMAILTAVLGIVPVCAVAQKASSTPAAKTKVTIAMTDRGPTSELPFIPIGMPIGVTKAEISAKYFGPQSDSDISFIVLAKSARLRYSGSRTFGISFLIDEVPLKSPLRMVNRVSADTRGESLQFFVTTEDLAWLTLGDKLEFVVHDADSGLKLDTFHLTAGGRDELKKFAKSVLLLRSMAPEQRQ